MHINIILGLLVIAALVWLVSRARSARRDPAKIMRREINRKQEEAETLEKAEATLQALRASRLKELETAIARMIQGIEREDRRPAVGRDSASGCITITLPSYSGLPSNIGSGDSQGQRRVADAPCRLDWNVSDFNVQLFASRNPAMRLYGEYSMRQGGETLARREELGDFLQNVSVIIAERVALL